MAFLLFSPYMKLLEMWQYTNKNFRRKFLQGNALAFPFFACRKVRRSIVIGNFALFYMDSYCSTISCSGAGVIRLTMTITALARRKAGSSS